MPPHRDWTRRGAGRALLYWPLVAFMLVAAFPALAVPLVACSGLGLVTIGFVGGFAGKRRRAHRLAKARRMASDLAAAALPTATGEPDREDAGHDEPTAWPTGRHRTDRLADQVLDDRTPEITRDPLTTTRPGALRPDAA